MSDPIAGPKTPEEHAGLRLNGIFLKRGAIAVVVGLFLWMKLHPVQVVAAKDTTKVAAGTQAASADDLVVTTPSPSPTPSPSLLPAQPTPDSELSPSYADVSSKSSPGVPTPTPVSSPSPTPTAAPTLSPAQIDALRRAAAARAREVSERESISSPLSMVVPSPLATPTAQSSDECCWIRESQEASLTLYTPIDNTVPDGTIRAYLDKPLEDWTHSIIVAPYGAVFVGRYTGTSMVIAGGKAKIPARFDKILIGNRVIKLDDEPGGDPTGANGINAAANRHLGAAIGSFIVQVGTALLLSRASGGSQYCGVNCAQTSTTNGGAISTAMQAGQQLFHPTASESLYVSETSSITVIFGHDYRVKDWRS